MTLQELLEQARAGDAVLFCGAGFSADCLGFDTPDTLGVGAHLLKIINEKLEELGEPATFRQLPTAARKYSQVAGEHGLMNLLQDRFRVSNVPERMVDILRFPWQRIYTTNYDNAVEMALGRIPKGHTPINNTDDPSSTASGLNVVHLHGYIGEWDIHNFHDSCILDTTSYLALNSVSKWLEQLRIDLERTSAVVFCGFSSNDLHLNQVFFNATALRTKCIFVNRPVAQRDEDAHITQEDFGLPLYVGLEGLAEHIRAALTSQTPAPLRLASFREFNSERPATELPSVDDIRDQFIFGAKRSDQIARDIFLYKSDYHILRDATEWAINQSENDGRVLLISGEVCDGKTIVAEDIAHKLAVSRPVFWMNQAYDDLLDEVARILERHPTALLVVENCFELRTDRLSALARQFASGNCILLLTARNIAADAETGKVKSLQPLSTFREFRLTALSDTEINVLEGLIDQFGGFAHLGALSADQRRRHIKNRWRASLPAVLLDVVNSDHVRSRYQEELRKLDGTSPASKSLLISALYAKHIGDPPPVSFLSGIFREDVGAIIKAASRGNNTFHLLRLERGQVETVPAIGASLILKEFFEDREIVNSVTYLLEEMSRSRRSTEYERYIFSQMMRYSRLATVVTERSEIQRFFDHISKIEYFRNEPLFWLQWHMANAADGRFVDAERLLERGYAEAKNWERRRGTKYNRKQLDDRRAKYLMQRAMSTDRSPADLFRDFKTALDIVQRLLRDAEITHHPYQTIETLVETLRAKAGVLVETHAALIRRQVDAAITQADARLGGVPQGYQRQGATLSLEAAKRGLA